MYFCSLMTEDLKEKTAKGLMWGAIANGGTQVLNLLIGIVLANLLLPSDYGIVGLLTIFTVLAASLSSSGFANGLINKSPSDNDYNSVFWFNVTVSIVCYVILFCCAPLIARFFHQPILVPLSRFVFLCFIITASGMSYNAYMVKNMMNREIAIISLLALVISGAVGIVLAWLDKGVWSLAWQQMIYILVTNLGRYWYVPWHPRFRFDPAPIKELFPFSVKILLTNIINTVSQQILTVAFGRLFPIHDVGNYTQANKWTSMGHQTISGTLQQVAQPVFVSVRDERNRELNVFRKMVRFASFLSFPALFGLAMIAHEFILCSIGTKWIDCIPLLQILCLSGAFMPLYTLLQNLVISHGRSDINMWLNIAQILLQIGIIFLFYKQGITALVIAYTVFYIVWIAAWLPAAHSIIGLRFLDLMRDVCPFLFIASATTAATYFLTLPIANLWLLLVLRIIIAALLYMAVMRLLHVAIMKECIQFIKQRRNRS